MNGILCLAVLIFCTTLFKVAGRYPEAKGYAILKPQIILGIICFSFFVGLRYNPDVDVDFLNYWYTAQYGPGFHEYYRFEVFPRFLADVVFYFHLSPSVWFILMGGILAFFTLFAACRLKNKFMAIVFYGLILMYLPFDMNVMRQGIAISVFLCAVTYIGERDWKKFLLFMIIAYCFHRSSIIWSVSYFLTYLNWNKRPLINMVVLAISAAFVFMGLDFFIKKFTFVFSLLGKEQVSSLSELDLMIMDKKGAGIGIIIRYIRWLFLLYYIPKIAKCFNTSSLYCIFALFVMGVVMDVYSMYSIILSRIALYPKITELLLYPYLLHYGNLKLKSGVLIKSMAVMQVLFLTYVLYGYLNKWNFISL